MHCLPALDVSELTASLSCFVLHTSVQYVVYISPFSRPMFMHLLSSLMAHALLSHAPSSQCFIVQFLSKYHTPFYHNQSQPTSVILLFSFKDFKNFVENKLWGATSSRNITRSFITQPTQVILLLSFKDFKYVVQNKALGAAIKESGSGITVLTQARK